MLADNMAQAGAHQHSRPVYSSVQTSALLLRQQGFTGNSLASVQPVHLLSTPGLTPGV